MFKFVKRWVVYIKLKGFSSAAIIITLIFSIAVIGLTIYGTKVGNFVVTIEENTDISLLLCEKEDFVNKTPRLLANGLEDMTNCTISDLPIDAISRLDGSSSDDKYKSYFAYNFYIKNFSGIALNYEARITIEEVFRDVDTALRVMVVTDAHRYGINLDNTTMFTKLDSNGIAPPVYNVDHISVPELRSLTMTNVFFDDPAYGNKYTICKFWVDGFKVNQIMKYTLIMWLEGEDENCTDDLLGGKIKMEMKFLAEKRLT